MENEEIVVLSDDENKKVIEAILFASGHMVTYKKLSEVLHIGVEEVKVLVAEYAREYNDSGLPRGVQLLVFELGCQLITKEIYGEYVREALGIKKGGNLSRSSLETLAIVAYNQPVTKLYVEKVRGVDSAYPLGVLRDRELIEEVGRLDVPGKPILYGTTNKFLVVFGLTSIKDLPIDSVTKSQVPKDNGDEQLSFSFDDEVSENTESQL